MTKAVRYLIVDDEVLSQHNLNQAINEHTTWECLGCASSAAKAKTLIETAAPDLVFLDIQMPRESGLALAHVLMKKTNPPLIIFVTAFDEHAIEAFRLHALDYLLKPINDLHLKQAIERAEQMLVLKQQANFAQSLKEMLQDQSPTTAQTSAEHPKYWEHLSIRSIGRIDRVAVADILWIEAQGNYMLLHLRDGRMMYRASMAQLEKHLDPKVFARTHRSVIVKLQEIASLQVLPDHSYQAKLKNGDQLPISERHIAHIKEALQPK